MTVELSIVIPSSRRPDLLANCLRSVQHHAPIGTEVVVVDDGSRDRVVTEIARAHQVTVHRHRRRQGFAAAANAGIQRARGRIVQLLNDDTEVAANWIAPALAHFREPKVAAVAPLVLSSNRKSRAGGSSPASRIDSAGDRYYIGGVAAKRFTGRRLPLADLKAQDVFGASGCASFYRRDAFLEAGGFPLAFGAYFEDVDLAFRLHRAGYIIRFEPGSRIWHLGGSSHGPPRGTLAIQMSRNEELVYWRNLPANDLRRTWPKHLAVLAGKALRRWHQGGLMPFVLGRLSALATSAEVRRHRHNLRRAHPAKSMGEWCVEASYWGNAQ